MIIDWHAIGENHPEFFYPDAIHLRPEGADFYANLVKSNIS